MGKDYIFHIRISSQQKKSMISLYIFCTPKGILREANATFILISY